MIKLTKFLHPELAFDCPVITNQKAVFQFVARRLAEQRLINNQEVLVEEFMKREQQGSTGVGHGIALPHVATEAVNQIVVAVVRLNQPMEWDAVDGKPVHLLVMIIAPPDQRKLYLQVLAEVARSLNQPTIRDKVLKARHPAQAVRIIARPPHEGFIKRNRRLFIFLLVVAVIFVLARIVLPTIQLPASDIYKDYTKFNFAPWLFRQELTITLFLAMILGTLLFWRFRVAIAGAGLGILLAAGVMDLETTVRFMSIPTILFIMSMMIIVRWLQNIGVFRFIVIKAMEKVHGVPWQLLLILMGSSVILGGFADEVSAILVTFGLALEVTRRTKAPLVPYLLCLVFATNVGSALTLIGNPVGIYIAFAGKLSFEHFLRWATPVSAIAALIIMGLCLLIYRRHFFGFRYKLDFAELRKTTETVDPTRLRTGIITFVTVICLIALHRRIEVWLNLGESTALVAVALLTLGFIVFHEQERGRLLVARGVDWWTLLFFMFLFANAACLEYTGVTTKLGYIIHHVANAFTHARAGAVGVTSTTAVLVLWFTGITSGFVDNLPIVAATVPIVKDLIRIGLPHASILWWALLFGGCFGGNMTVIGSTANLVAVGAFERATGQSIRFTEWIKVGIIITVVSLSIATVALLLQVRMAP
ncbi:hypothetical protein CH330_02130 [candidate division WOR-3 bacterium JGI_Cruoil_03_51_56]|uniref:PTS EIIA type-2 domain-containing protein n=1 Tax=candidate division WOR-3 bacterium JGI_Cruoil_03_51_56 TaxID=1973747 RepID=A0A235BWV3_UNCW3|nr:MAG: hypothetical protein CH330_02130 [candidate division WOR-3 bacterium JGI_Cruoil_03_51_56]